MSTIPNLSYYEVNFFLFENHEEDETYLLKETDFSSLRLFEDPPSVYECISTPFFYRCVISVSKPLKRCIYENR